ncbi:MAG: hypothetical protein KDK76_01485 [Chlamydiia bacterium]|nr:hypothetical protein [Chlamydiia bacterium]
MSAYREPTPFDDPFPGGFSVLKGELSRIIEALFYTFEHREQNKEAMSEQLRLNEGMILLRAREIGGKVALCAQELMQASTDYANGHGKIEMVYECLELLRDELAA